MLVPGINQSDATSQCDMDNKMHLYYRTHIFTVQGRAFTPDDYCCVGCCFLFDSLREKRSVPLTKPSGIACFKYSRGTRVDITGLRKRALFFCAGSHTCALSGSQMSYLQVGGLSPLQIITASTSSKWVASSLSSLLSN